MANALTALSHLRAVDTLTQSTAAPADASQRSFATWAPLAAALLLDVADFFSLGPQGLVIGLLLGTTLGWRIAAASGLSRKWRWAAAVASAVYCILPATELLPMASIVTTAVRVRQLISTIGVR